MYTLIYINMLSGTCLGTSGTSIYGVTFPLMVVQPVRAKVNTWHSWIDCFANVSQ